MVIDNTKLVEVTMILVVTMEVELSLQAPFFKGLSPIEDFGSCGMGTYNNGDFERPLNDPMVLHNAKEVNKTKVVDNNKVVDAAIKRYEESLKYSVKQARWAKKPAWRAH